VAITLAIGAGPLANGTVNTDHILPLLIEDGIDRDRGFARLAIAHNQFPLPPPHGNQGIHHLHPRLQRHLSPPPAE
jgi:hypothetical protein